MAIVVGLSILWQSSNSVLKLELIERQRDSWQKPEVVLEALDLTLGDRVVDVGCGSGYFSLKLAKLVGGSGAVVAVDIRPVALFCLSARAWLYHLNNIEIKCIDSVRAPNQYTSSAAAVLIANTYHEISNRGEVLNAASASLKPGGRLVIVDRVDDSVNCCHLHETQEQHGISYATAIKELEASGFLIDRRYERFTRGEQSDWWMIVSHKRP